MLLNQTIKRPTTDKEVVDIIRSLIGENNNLAIPNGYPESFEGLIYMASIKDSEYASLNIEELSEYPLEYRVLYNQDSMTTKLMTEDKMSASEAIEFLEFNTWYTKPPEGNMPLYIETF